MKRYIVGLLTAMVMVITLTAALPLNAAGASPDIPRGFYGTVSINGSPAPIRTIIEARGTGIFSGVAGNPLTTTQSGYYGQASEYGDKLVVQGKKRPDCAGYRNQLLCQWSTSQSILRLAGFKHGVPEQPA